MPPAADPALEAPERLRFAELMAVLAAASERAMGQSADQALQGCALALRLARAWGLQGSELRQVYYLALLRFIGCNAETSLMADIAGDVQALRRAMAPLDTADARRVLSTLYGHVRQAHPGWAATAGALLQAPRFEAEIFPGHCEVAQRLGRRLGFDERFIAALGQLYARWDGQGVPDDAADELLPAVRVVQIAQDLVLHGRLGGWAAAVAVAEERSGAQYDPALVDLALARGEALLAGLPSRWDDLLELEPGPQEYLDGAALEAAFEVLGDYADLQSRWLMAHSRRVAGLVAGASAALGWPETQQRWLRRAARVHDLGRVAVSTHVWDKAGPLSDSEWDQVRLHATHTAQVLARAPSLAALARLAGGAHERGDGSGYAGVTQGSLAARLLAAADVVAALGEDRPHRAAYPPEVVQGRVTELVSLGRLDAEAARAVLGQLGLALAPRPLPAGLSPREAEVLRELAQGLTNKQIAKRLGVSPKTVGHQVEAIYRKAEVNTRAGATLFALEQGLLGSMGPMGPMGHLPDAGGGRSS